MLPKIGKAIASFLKPIASGEALLPNQAKTTGGPQLGNDSKKEGNSGSAFERFAKKDAQHFEENPDPSEEVEPQDSKAPEKSSKKPNRKSAEPQIHSTHSDVSVNEATSLAHGILDLFKIAKETQTLTLEDVSGKYGKGAKGGKKAKAKKGIMYDETG